MTINYIEKGFGLHETIRAAGYRLYQNNNVWVSSNDAAVQALIDGYTLQQCRDYRITLMRIYAADLQRTARPTEILVTATARFALLLEKRINGVALTTTEQSTLTRLHNILSYLDDVEATAITHENGINACNTFRAILNYNYKLNWPA